MEIQHLFQFSTIAAVSPYVEPLHHTTSQEIVEGDVPLTPIQKWFFEKEDHNRHHFNLVLLLKGRGGFDEKIIKPVFNQLIKHHDALRMIFTGKLPDKEIKQINRGMADDWLQLNLVDLRNEIDHETKITEACEQIQDSIDLSNGPLLKLALFRTRDGDYLLIVIHHLVMDGVSWQILLEDFSTLYKQTENNEKPVLPLKSTSYKEWAEKLFKYAGNKNLLEELTYWRQLEKTAIIPLPKDHQNKPEENTFKNKKRLSMQLTKESTEKLLKEVNRAYNTKIDEILLSALGLAVYDWIGHQKILIGLEGHGRENMVEDVDLTRTIGWFTSMYPLVIYVPAANNLAQIIKSTKETLRQVPNKGIGYGILKYLTLEPDKQACTFNLKPEIGFNYFGQFNREKENDLFKVANISAGNSIAPDCHEVYQLEIVGIIAANSLTMEFNYNSSTYNKDTIAGFLNKFEKRLLQIIDHCTSKEETELTLSDFGSAIEEQELESVFDMLGDITLNE
jgi:non-ribosomal peptide synthase protein (TIGR01720 family)